MALSVLSVSAILRLTTRGLQPLDTVEIAVICYVFVSLAIINWLERE